MNNKNQVYILIIVIVLFLTGVMAFTFAYIGSANMVGGNTNVSATINGAILTYTGNTSISIDIDYDDLTSSSATNDYSNYISNTATGTVTLNVPSYYASGVTCQYNITYTPTIVYTPSSAATSGSLKELELVLASGGSTLKTQSLHNLSSKTTLYTTTISTNIGNTTASQNYTATLKFYNLNVDQGDALGQRPSGLIAIEGITCGGNS